ncbi:dihydrofolate reductase family protein [Leptospira levettii]|uniref:Dihydrofolate reductase n=1 Tax=Leptospira levettii TaxID=2023178 RepID=A0ABY2MRI3_9LEPT|nr:dihydrofolate reductase family protein [Leptospira levettii]PKA25423.1 dihydrofolate reductase [Leptospira sp. mixed culture ATI2-C-A1]MCW7507719.1 dihydrofolate reductase family protein [Leptospira levettii]MCW7518809.1 dihydrofolate reductase family protein [Leptospira levettii]TGK98835.1 dihydrofolate reductase [Leptospira levettii]TGL73448.1 dihydrofolate reductase [Leptospira levettii]
MRKVVFGINVSSDGFYGHTGMVVDEDLHQYFTEFLKQSDQILYGRITYDLMVPFWPDVAKNKSMSPVSNEFADVFTSLEKILFSHTVTKVSDPNTTIATRSLEEEVKVLKKQVGRDISIGSLSIASQLSSLGLIDEYRFVIHPVIVGQGPRLFSDHPLKTPVRLDLIDTKMFSSGNIAHHYKTRREN